MYSRIYFLFFSDHRFQFDRNTRMATNCRLFFWVTYTVAVYLNFSNRSSESVRIVVTSYVQKIKVPNRQLINLVGLLIVMSGNGAPTFEEMLFESTHSSRHLCIGTLLILNISSVSTK